MMDLGTKPMGQRLAEAKHRLRTAIAKALTLESERDEARRKLAEMTADRDRAQHGYEQEHLLRHDALGQLGACEQERTNAREECTRLEKQLEEQAMTIHVMGIECGRLEADIKTCELERDQARAAADQWAAECKVLKANVDFLTSRYREANGESVTLQRKLYDALGQLEQEQRSREQAEARCEELRAERDGAQGSRMAARD